jgi:hypothetical protein
MPSHGVGLYGGILRRAVLLHTRARIVIGERVCDKIAASKRKGIWVGVCDRTAVASRGSRACVARISTAASVRACRFIPPSTLMDWGVRPRCPITGTPESTMWRTILACPRTPSSALDELKEESAKATDELRASCPTQTAENPVARLDAMSDRLHAMVQAIEAVRPKFAAFYASLNDEQKARFNAWANRTPGRPNTLPPAAAPRPPGNE